MKGELLVIVEYCRFGNLQTYIFNQRSNFINLVDEFGNIRAENEEFDIKYERISMKISQYSFKLFRRTESISMGFNFEKSYENSSNIDCESGCHK